MIKNLFLVFVSAVFSTGLMADQIADQNREILKKYKWEIKYETNDLYTISSLENNNTPQPSILYTSEKLKKERGSAIYLYFKDIFTKEIETNLWTDITESEYNTLLRQGKKVNKSFKMVAVIETDVTDFTFNSFFARNSGLLDQLSKEVGSQKIRDKGKCLFQYYYYLDEWKYKLEIPPAVDINNQKLLTVVTMNMYCTAGTINYYIGDLKK